MVCETEAKKLADALIPAKKIEIQCDIIEQKLWNEYHKLKATCTRDIGGGRIAGAIAGIGFVVLTGGTGLVVLGTGAAIGGGLGGLGGGLTCAGDASTFDNLVVEHDGCRELYDQELQTAVDECTDLIKCQLRNKFSFLQ